MGIGSHGNSVGGYVRIRGHTVRVDVRIREHAVRVDGYSWAFSVRGRVRVRVDGHTCVYVPCFAFQAT